MKSEELYDVVIYEDRQLIVTTIGGRNLPMNQGQFNAERRLATIQKRLLKDFSAKIVPHNSCIIGKPLGAGIEVDK